MVLDTHLQPFHNLPPLNRQIFITGPAGCGKSFCLQQLLAIGRIPSEQMMYFSIRNQNPPSWGHQYPGMIVGEGEFNNFIQSVYNTLYHDVVEVHRTLIFEDYIPILPSHDMVLLRDLITNAEDFNLTVIIVSRIPILFEPIFRESLDTIIMVGYNHQIVSVMYQHYNFSLPTPEYIQQILENQRNMMLLRDIDHHHHCHFYQLPFPTQLESFVPGETLTQSEEEGLLQGCELVL